MKTHLKYIITIVLSGIIISCDNSLDEKVYSSVTQQSYKYTTEDFHPAIANIYSYLRSSLDQWGFFCGQEVTGNAIVLAPNASGWDDGGVYRRMHYHTWNSEQAHVSNMWNWFYRGVLICNNVLDQIEREEIPSPSAAEKEAGLAEIRAMRAYYYWMICDNFGEAPLVIEKTSDLPAKSSRKEIYEFIVKELTEVIPNLNEEQGGNMYGRMSKWAAKATLANVYLNAEVYTGEARWNECIEQCNDIINSNKCALSDNYNASFRATGVESSKEVIFTVPFDRDYGEGNFIHMYSWHGELKKKFETEATPWGSGAAMGLTQFIDTYDVDDSRLEDTWLMGPQYAADGTQLTGTYDKKGEPFVYTKDIPSANYTSEMEGYRMNKFEVIAGSTNNSTTDLPVFRYAQVLMMKAECLLRTGQGGAGALVSEVRKRAFKEHPDKATVTDEQLKENSVYQYGYVENYKIIDPGNQESIQFGRMLDELGWEFAWELQSRRNLIRFGVFTKKSWLSHKPQGDYRSVFPIPEKVLTSNPNLEQNPNYVQ
ncbi:RagB/SusD family nutrient uptake outer membrane protein [Massilibacteroides sp.]|uniref:RagB/SusD family nutrient uptake outer membrane protein n=1 Tax=Massilibacteroides sp. TaxID=2034766 RepID=UPI002624B540|nr:RagB/SusD family nutrient uptake outer membrane protein [Massilibacteroides sp.]MDD4515856.1 RagB/SusD family nutrient uptake outer membrane protein [Massilibacteroides sp.]